MARTSDADPPAESRKRRPGVRSTRGSGWSRQVTRESNALDLEPGVFALDDPAEVARSLQRSAERSRRRRSEPFRSAMSMLNFYINRAGRGLPQERRLCLEQSREELHILYARAPRAARGEGVLSTRVRRDGANATAHPRWRPTAVQASRPLRQTTVSEILTFRRAATAHSTPSEHASP